MNILHGARRHLGSTAALIAIALAVPTAAMASTSPDDPPVDSTTTTVAPVTTVVETTTVQSSTTTAAAPTATCCTHDDGPDDRSPANHAGSSDDAGPDDDTGSDDLRAAGHDRIDGDGCSSARDTVERRGGVGLADGRRSAGLPAVTASYGSSHRDERRGQGDVDGADDRRLLLRWHQLRLLRPSHFVRRVVGTFRWHVAQRDDHEHQPHDQWAAQRHDVLRERASDQRRRSVRRDGKPQSIPFTVPGTMSQMRATAGNGRATLTWTAPGHQRLADHPLRDPTPCRWRPVGIRQLRHCIDGAQLHGTQLAQRDDLLLPCRRTQCRRHGGVELSGRCRTQGTAAAAAPGIAAAPGADEVMRSGVPDDLHPRWFTRPRLWRHRLSALHRPLPGPAPLRRRPRRHRLRSLNEPKTCGG